MALGAWRRGVAASPRMRGVAVLRQTVMGDWNTLLDDAIDWLSELAKTFSRQTRMPPGAHVSFDLPTIRSLTKYFNSSFGRYYVANPRGFSAKERDLTIHVAQKLQTFAAWVGGAVLAVIFAIAGHRWEDNERRAIKIYQFRLETDLTKQNPDDILSALGIPPHQFRAVRAPHERVPHHLSGSGRPSEKPEPLRRRKPAFFFA